MEKESEEENFNENENLENETNDVAEKPAKSKKEKAKKLTCLSSQRLAFNNEEVVLENDDVKIIMQIKNPALHGKFVKGKLHDFSVS